MLLNQRLVEGGSAKPVYVVNPSEFPGGGVQDVNVTNTNLDIRDLNSALDSVAIGDGVDQLFINSDGSINVSQTSLGLVNTGNSTNTPLLADGVFTGIGVDVLNYATIMITIFADQPSATNGVEFQFSLDNSDWHTTDTYTYENNGAYKTYSLQTVDRYFRIVYTNTSVDQTHFDLSVILKKMAGIASSHRIGDSLANGEDDASLVKAIIAAKTPTGSYENVDSDSEGRLKVNVVTPTGIVPVAQLNTLRDGKILNRLFPELDEVAGTPGSFTGNSYIMAVTAGQWTVYQSRKLAEYYSGKPQKVEFTFDNFAPQTNIIKRVGYFNSSTTSPYDTVFDGIWLESSNGTITLKASRSGTETISANILNWTNYDELKEYQNLSTWNNFTVCEINFLWLGGAYVELRLVTSSGFTTVHQVVYAGTNQDVFIDYPNHSMRYEIRHIGASGTGEFRYICNQIATSGSIQESGLGKGVSNGATPITFSSTANTYPLIAVRKGANYRENFVSITNADILITTNDTLQWSLQINPTLSADLTYTPLANSAIEYASGNGTITVTSPGLVIANGYLTQGDSIDANLFQKNYLTTLSGSITGVQDQYVLCIHPISSSLSALGSINLLEG